MRREIVIKEKGEGWDVFYFGEEDTIKTHYGPNGITSREEAADFVLEDIEEHLLKEENV